MMIIENSFSLGDLVSCISDENDLGRLITGIVIYPGNQLMYICKCGNIESYHYEIELTLKVGIDRSEDLPGMNKNDNLDSDEA